MVCVYVKVCIGANTHSAEHYKVLIGTPIAKGVGRVHTMSRINCACMHCTRTFIDLIGLDRIALDWIYQITAFWSKQYQVLCTSSCTTALTWLKRHSHLYRYQRQLLTQASPPSGLHSCMISYVTPPVVPLLCSSSLNSFPNNLSIPDTWPSIIS